MLVNSIILLQAVVFVIDSSNHDRLAEAHSELAKLMSEKELKDASLLIFANKQVSHNFTLLLILPALGLDPLLHVQSCYHCITHIAGMKDR